MQPARIEVVPNGAHWFVRVHEDGVTTDVPFDLLSSATSFANGQRKRLGLPFDAPSVASKVSREQNA